MISIQKHSMQENNIGAAARRQCQELIGRILFPSLDMQLRERIAEEASTIVDITCGAGEFLSGLKNKIDEKARLIGFDSDPVNVARTATRLKEDSRVQLYPTAFTHIEFDLEAHCIIGACTLNAGEQNRAIVQKAGEVLVPGGFLFLNFLDLAQAQSFPKSYALNRYNDFMCMYQEGLDMDLSHEGVRALCTDLNFNTIEVQRMIPKFLSRPERKLPLLLLEYIGTFLIESEVCSQEELDAIISELNHLAAKEEILISAPVVLQLTATKI